MEFIPKIFKSDMSASLRSALTLSKSANEFVDIYFESSDKYKESNEVVIGAKEHEIISFDSCKLKAYEIKENDLNKFVVSVCDYRQEVNEMIDFVREFSSEGYNNIVIPQRLDPNFISKGVYDLSQWINYITSIYPDSKLYLYGEGYGANTVVKYLQTSSSNNIKCCILDNLKPLDIKDKLDEYINNKNINSKKLMYFKVDSILKDKYEINLNDLSIKKCVINNEIPLCFIYNKNLKNYSEVLRIYNSTKGDKKFFFTNVLDRNQHQENYFRTLKQYIKNI